MRVAVTSAKVPCDQERCTPEVAQRRTTDAKGRRLVLFHVRPTRASRRDDAQAPTVRSRSRSSRPPYRARHRRCDGSGTTAPTTLMTKAAAQAWLARKQVRLEQEAAGAPRSHPPPRVTLRDYGTAWLERADPRPTTRRSYSQLWQTIDADLPRGKGLSKETAHAVAAELTAIDPFVAHVEAELGLDPNDLTDPTHAAISSGIVLPARSCRSPRSPSHPPTSGRGDVAASWSERARWRVIGQKMIRAAGIGTTGFVAAIRRGRHDANFLRVRPAYLDAG